VGGRPAIQWEGGTWSRIERRRGGTHTSRDSGDSKEGGRVKGERRSAAARVDATGCTGDRWEQIGWNRVVCVRL
jgi:hypothetical protein